jgi:SAM-dependent methyltransferase
MPDGTVLPVTHESRKHAEPAVRRQRRAPVGDGRDGSRAKGGRPAPGAAAAAVTTRECHDEGVRFAPALFVAMLAAVPACRDIPGRDVRFEPTPMPAVRKMLEVAGVAPQDVVYDLGSGDGRIPIMAAKEFGARGVGIEIDPELVRRAQADARAAGVADRVEFRLGDMYAADVSPATVVTLFLHPGPNLKLRETLRADLRAGSRIVSYVWDMGSWKPDEVQQVMGRRIFLWRIAVPAPPH